MSLSKPFSIRMKKKVQGKVVWIEEEFATAYDLSVFYEKNTPKKTRKKQSGKNKKNKGKK